MLASKSYLRTRCGSWPTLPLWTGVPFGRADIWLPHLATWRELALASHEWWTRARIRRGREPRIGSERSRFAMPPTPWHHLGPVH